MAAKQPPNTFNHNQHDFLVELANDTDWADAAGSVGWDPKSNTVRSQVYGKIMPALNMSSGEGLDFEEIIKAVRREAKLRGYGTANVFYMTDGEPRETIIEELGEIPPRFVPVLTGPAS